MRTGGLDVSFVTSALHGGEWTVSRSGRFTSHCVGCWVVPESVWTPWRQDPSPCQGSKPGRLARSQVPGYDLSPEVPHGVPPPPPQTAAGTMPRTLPPKSQLFGSGCAVRYSAEAVGVVETPPDCWVPTQTKLRGLSPRTHYADRATAACQCQLLRSEWCRVICAADSLRSYSRFSRPELLLFLPSSS
jgi:hypothetical protein